MGVTLGLNDSFVYRAHLFRQTAPTKQQLRFRIFFFIESFFQHRYRVFILVFIFVPFRRFLPKAYILVTLLKKLLRVLIVLIILGVLIDLIIR